MSGTQLLKRIAMVTLMTAVFFLLLSVIRLEATPIKPDVQELLARPSRPADQFGPARAGWNGPEMQQSTPLNLTYEQIGPTATARQVRGALVASFIPDYRALAGVLLVIMLLRRISKSRRPAMAGVGIHATPSLPQDLAPAAANEPAEFKSGEGEFTRAA